MPKAPKNKTIELTDTERERFAKELVRLDRAASVSEILNKIINQDIFDVLDFLPSSFVDLMFVDPPYNLTKNFKSGSFRKLRTDDYADWIDSWLGKMVRLLKNTSSVYVCCDWRSSSAVHKVCEKYFIVRNRITFEREKGRGASKNWKNNSEDIWFCTMSGDYYFNANAVRLKRRVLAPYRENGTPKDWSEENGEKYRLTAPSNIWTDITIPFWSMPENTPHPTQKPEKLVAKIILASSKKGDIIFDPFAGVGTTGVVAKKLDRNFVMVEIEKEYCIYAQKRLELAQNNRSIQGYEDGVFWERNTPRKKLNNKQE